MDFAYIVSDANKADMTSAEKVFVPSPFAIWSASDCDLFIDKQAGARCIRNVSIYLRVVNDRRLT